MRDIGSFRTDRHFFSSDLVSSDFVSNEKGGARTDTLVKLVLVFFISLLSFSVGTFVGKEFSDKKHRLASVAPEYGEGDETANKKYEVPSGDALTAEDIERLNEDFVNADSQAVDKPHPMEKTGEAVAAADGQARQAASEKVAAVADRIAEGKTPTPAAKTEPARTPTSLPPSVLGQFTVQVASYSTQNEADEYAKSLKDKGFSAFVVPAEIRGQTWYRVSVGAYSTREEARQSQQRLMKQADISSAIVQKIGNL